MSKHRDLAQLVYAKILGRESASRIWRTVVVAGAMLASPMTAHAGGDNKPVPSAPSTAKTEKPPANAPAAGAPAPAQSRPAPPPPTKAELAKQARDNLAAIEAELTAVEEKVRTSLDEVKDSHTEDETEAAKTKHSNFKKQKAELKTKQTAAKAEVKKADAAAKAEANANKPKPRPRTPENIRPKGRGFILS